VVSRVKHRRAGSIKGPEVRIRFPPAAFVTEIVAPVGSILSVRLVDVGQDKTLYSGFSPQTSGASPYGDTFAFGGRYYRAETVPTASYVKQHRRWQSWAVKTALTERRNIK
jgi:hypothetical protein